MAFKMFALHQIEFACGCGAVKTCGCDDECVFGGCLQLLKAGNNCTGF